MTLIRALKGVTMDIHYKTLRDLSFSSPVLPKVFDFATYGISSAPRSGWGYVANDDFFRIGGYYHAGNKFFFVADIKEDCCALITSEDVGLVFVHTDSYFKNCFGHNFCRFVELTKQPIIWERDNECTYIHPYNRVLPIKEEDYTTYINQQIDIINIKRKEEKKYEKIG